MISKLCRSLYPLFCLFALLMYFACALAGMSAVALASVLAGALAGPGPDQLFIET